MPTNYLRVDRDDLSGSAPPGTIEIRDPRPAPPIEQAEHGSYKVLLDDTVIGALGNFQAVRVELAPGEYFDTVDLARQLGIDANLMVQE